MVGAYAIERAAAAAPCVQHGVVTQRRRKQRNGLLFPFIICRWMDGWSTGVCVIVRGWSHHRYNDDDDLLMISACGRHNDGQMAPGAEKTKEREGENMESP